MRMLLKKILLTEDLEPNYLFLLIALMIIIIFPAIAAFLGNPIWVFHICYCIVILTSILYSLDRKHKITLGSAIGFITLLSYWLEVTLTNDISKTANLIANFIFFNLLLFQVIIETINEKNVNVNTLYAVSVGYLLLGMMGFGLLSFLDASVPNSFAGNFSNFRRYDLIYMSFITLTSVGYGDIHPVNPEGKAICLLIGLVGQLYISFMVAVIVGKYLNRKTS